MTRQADQAEAVSDSKPSRVPLIRAVAARARGSSHYRPWRTDRLMGPSGSLWRQQDCRSWGGQETPPTPVSSGPPSPRPAPDPTSFLKLMLKTAPPPWKQEPPKRPRSCRNLTQGNLRNQQSLKPFRARVHTILRATLQEKCHEFVPLFQLGDPQSGQGR